jgi:DNA-binding IclR family transcriptional regulator
MAVPRDHAALCRILEYLRDGSHRSIKEIEETLKLGEETTLEILNFLADYDFLIKDTRSDEVFLDPKLERLIQE